MSFFTTLTATILAAPEKDTDADGNEVIKIKAVNQVCKPAMPVWLVIPADTENAKDLASMADKTAQGEVRRVLVTGVLQIVAATRSEDKQTIEKAPNATVYVAAYRRIRMDLNKEPEQAVVMGSGFSAPVNVEHRNADSDRKPEIYISTGNESLLQEGKYASQLHCVGDVANKNVGELFKTVGEGTEVYFVGNLFRIKGDIPNGGQYDKLKTSVTFALETDRVKTRGYQAKTKQASMKTQLDDSFEDDEPATNTLSAEQLADQARVTLADF